MIRAATPKKRSDYIDYLKAVAIILVVLGHSFSYMLDKTGQGGGTGYSDLGTIQMLIYSVHVPLFFVVAGFLCHSQPFKKYLDKKINRLLIPFFFFSLLKIVYVNFVNASFAHAGTLSGQLYDAFILGKLYWFPYVLFWCYILAPIFWKLSTKANVIICVACLALNVIQSNFPSLSWCGWFGVLLLPKWLGLFLIGFIIAQNKEFFIRLGKHSEIIPLIAFLLIVVVLNVPDYSSSVGAAKFFVLSISEMVLIAYGLYWIKEGSDVLKKIAKYSLQIMFMDSFFKVVLFLASAKAGFTLNASLAFVLAVINIALCILACEVLSKNKLSARLVGL